MYDAPYKGTSIKLVKIYERSGKVGCLVVASMEHFSNYSYDNFLKKLDTISKTAGKLDCLMKASGCCCCCLLQFNRTNAFV
jgi:hypothetical protein